MIIEGATRHNVTLRSEPFDLTGDEHALILGQMAHFMDHFRAMPRALVVTPDEEERLLRADLLKQQGEAMMFEGIRVRPLQ